MPYSALSKDGKIQLDNIPDELAIDSPELKARFEKERAKMVAEFKPEEKQNFILGATREFIAGQTFGFSDEAGSAIAAGVAAGVELVTKGANPVETFNREFPLMVEQIRIEQDEFQEQNPKTAIGLNIAGGLATGLAGAGKAIAKTGAKEVIKATAKAGTAKLAATGAVVGGVAGAGFSDSNEFFSVDTAVDTAIAGTVGAVLGPLVPKVLNSATKTVRRVLGKAKLKVFDDAGKFTNEALDELEKRFKPPVKESGRVLPKKGFKPAKAPEEIQETIRQDLIKRKILTPEQAKRFNLFAKRDVRPLTANITQSTDDSVELQSLLKTSKEVAEEVAGQDASLIKAAQDGVANIGQISDDLANASHVAFRATDKIVRELDNTVNAAYTVAKEAAKGQPRVTFNNYAKAVSDLRGSEKASGGVISFAKRELINKGLIKKGASVDINKRGPRVAGDNLKKTTVEEAERIRQGLNDLWDSVTPHGKRLITKLKNSLDLDVENAVGKDIFADARASKVNMMRIIERAKRDKFDTTGRNFLQKVIHNEIPAEDIGKRLLNAADDDFLNYKNFLLNDAGADGVQAWNDIKANWLNDAINKAIDTAGKREGGQTVFNANIFKKSINAIKAKGTKYTEIFNADEQELIADIIEIGRLRNPISGTFSGKGPTELAVEELKKDIWSRIPVGKHAKGISDAVTNIKRVRRQVDVTKETGRFLSE